VIFLKKDIRILPAKRTGNHTNYQFWGYAGSEALITLINYL